MHYDFYVVRHCWDFIETIVQDRIVDGRALLQSRGYDCAGIAIKTDARSYVSKAVGTIAN